MKKKTTRLLLWLISLIVIDYIFHHIKLHQGISMSLYAIEYSAKYGVIFFLTLDLFNKKFFDLDLKISAIPIIIILVLFSYHISKRLIAVDKYYYGSKTITKKCTPGLWQFDDILGHRGVPNANGAYLYFLGDSIKGQIPVSFDSSGYRIVPDSLKLTSEKLDLYLGCSCTFGDYVEAEDTFPYLTSKRLDHNYVNAAASAYGLGQMYYLAHKLISSNAFEYVFIQMSPWLVDRGMNLNGPIFSGCRPFPYFRAVGDTFQLNPPAFRTSIYSYGEIDWRKSRASYLEKLYFFVSEGFRIQILDYYAYKWAVIKIKLGLIPKPTVDDIKLERFVYDKLLDLCYANSATPVLLKLFYQREECDELVSYLSDKAMVIDLDEELDRISNFDEDLFKRYFQIYHVQGQDTLWYDDHPNPRAHAMFAEKIYDCIGKNFTAEGREHRAQLLKDFTTENIP